MKYNWIASTIEIKPAVLPYREINSKHCHFYVNCADFKSL